MLPVREDDAISVDSDSVDSETTIEVEDEYADMPPLIPAYVPNMYMPAYILNYPSAQNNAFLDVLFVTTVLNTLIQEEPEDNMYEELERVWSLLNFCKDTEAIERNYDADFSDYVTGEDFVHNEFGYQLDDCDGYPLKFSTIETMIKEHKQVNNPRTRKPILYFTKVKVLKL